MKYFFDTEFMEKPNTIELISIGIKCEDKRTFYALNKDLNVKKVWKDKWLKENVLMPIWKEQISGFAKNILFFSLSTMKWIFKNKGLSIKELGIQIKRFVYQPALEYDDGMKSLDMAVDQWLKDNQIEFYAYYADYDWVVFCWIFGRMIDLPKGFPMYCKDLKQIMDEKGLNSKWKEENCPDPENEHSALADAKWNFDFYNKLNNK